MYRHPLDKPAPAPKHTEEVVTDSLSGVTELHVTSPNHTGYDTGECAYRFGRVSEDTVINGQRVRKGTRIVYHD